eukprot:TRINITY_DN4234_c4_g1_i1.p1 TRINITY_DN4234_c4_g1~~TRINITY_DN4234_c4_g1_i1.p1  ORF type:complete len:233 (+),score=70.61 TRINITY_DN4234_c4_g1_i1:90-788(+)
MERRSVTPGQHHLDDEGDYRRAERRTRTQDLQRRRRRHHRHSGDHNRRLLELTQEARDISGAASCSATSEEVLRRLHMWRKLLTQGGAETGPNIRAQRQVFAELTEFVQPNAPPPMAARPAPRRRPDARPQQPAAPTALPQIASRHRQQLAAAEPDEAERSRLLHNWGIDKAYARRFRLASVEELPEAAEERKRVTALRCARMMRQGAESPKYYKDHKGHVMFANGVQGCSK